MESAERELYSVGEVAELLGLHVRTVRNYVRDGRLKAVRIGKQYRVSRADLAALAGLTGEGASPEGASPRGHLEVSSIVQIDAIGEDGASRLSTLVTAAARSGRDTAEPLRVQTVHDAKLARMKIVILGGAAATADLLRLIEGALGPGNGMFLADGGQAVRRG
ncbi:helix-turn-helix domain-containing protein [Streptomyces sp. NBC_00654]|uniref:helix-turn-helix domain-containing protein n=1 Tax=Streptomyces sp. NBC_00654 TaxID=2975799 RepID=UPI0022583D5A|nr:helix-turn-helix domain-containing protein [Streptomyces sp. NBC_00654]MCX4965631.1 helix-turn-helix domain-containing protein [Streptomyces sp. NBC_00654]